MKQVAIGTVTVGNDLPLTVIAGPCQIESLDHAAMIAGTMAEVYALAGAQFIFKADRSEELFCRPGESATTTKPTLVFFNQGDKAL